MKRILVTGAYGFLGPTLCSHLEAAGHLVFRQGRSLGAQIRCDLSDRLTLGAVIDGCAPDVLINLAAKTNVDDCETDVGAAFDANVRAVESIALALDAKRGIQLVHISTDQLYGGPGPHLENDVFPINVYGVTKYAGELVASQIGGTVLRTNFVGRSPTPGRKSLSDWIVGALSGGTPITVFQDILFSPLHVSTLCRFIERAAVTHRAGVYNLGSRGGVSKSEFAIALARQLKLDTRSMRVGDSSSALFRAKRPLDMTMSVDKFEHAFSCRLPSIADEICLAARDFGAP